MSNTRRSSWSALGKLGAVRACALKLRSAERLDAPGDDGTINLGRHGVYRLRCSWCDTTLDQWSAQIDHVVPRCQLGEDRNDNMLASCPECNAPSGTSRWEIGRYRPRRVTPEIRAVLAAPVDLKAGRALGLLWYPDWLPERLGLNKPPRELSQSPGAIKMRRLRERWRAERLSGVEFPFGANAAE